MSLTNARATGLWRTVNPITLGWCLAAMIVFGICAERAAGELKVRAVDVHEKVFRDAEPLAAPGKVVLRAARNEYEPGQVALRSEEALKSVRIEITASTHTDGKAVISREQIAWNLVGFIPLKKNGPHSEQLPLRAAPCEVPDPLLEPRSLDVPANSTQPAWITVHVPRDAIPGLYHGEMSVVANNVHQTIPVELQISDKDVAWLREATRQRLRGCRIQSTGGVWLHTPDGVGNYRALWTRDFEYMVEYAGDLLDPGEIKQSIQYLLAGQRDDGCMPDRVNVAGEGVFSPGPEKAPMADHALDNGAFMAKLVCSYVRLTGDLEFFRQVEPAIRRGLDHTRRAANGLVYNPPEAPQCPYGFTDTVAKTGHLLFCSLLYYDACRKMTPLCREASCGEPDEYQRRAESIRKSIRLLWNADAGMFWAADRDCKQIDIWGSAFAASVGCASDAQADRIADYLIVHYDGIVQRGQVRHLPAGQTWRRFMRPQGPKPDTYQNGAFWATPVAWIAPTIARRDPARASRMVNDVIADFRQHGIMECVNGDYHAVPQYVASATNVWGLVKGDVP